MGCLKRFAGNPIITKNDVSFPINSIFNAGAVKIDQQYVLLNRIEMPTGRSSFLLGTSQNGSDFSLEDKPCFTPADHGEWFEYVEWGIEDPRITRIDNWYYIVYTGYSKFEPIVMLSRTKDFHKYEILGTITEPSNKDAVLFPEKINGYYWKIDRPSGEHRRDMWISKSPDLLHWGSNRFLLEGSPGTWEQTKIGASTPPVKTKEGWLMLYHGVRGFGVSSIYKQGVILLDLDEPWKIVGKSVEPLFAPEHEYERLGDVPNVVFTTGWIREDDGEIKIYYSGADMNICLATTTENDLLSLCQAQ